MIVRFLFSVALLSLLVFSGFNHVFASEDGDVRHELMDVQLLAGVEKYLTAAIPFQAFAASEIEGVQVKYYQSGVWTDWQWLEYEEEQEKGSALSFVELSFAFALRSLEDVDLQVTLMNFLYASDDVVSSDHLVADVGISSREIAYGDNGDTIRIVSRREWGANESIGTYVPDNSADGDSGSSTNICAPLERSYPGQYTVSRKVEYNDERGRNLIWPQQYSTRVKKIVIHHTAQDLKDLNGDGLINSRDYKLGVQAIYTYHTLTRGWGDIGYHYIVDPDGKIYEGRAGGLKVIGAHVLCQNSNTVGVSVMGNYQNDRLSNKAYEGLVKITHYLTEIYDINPLGKSSFRGKILPHIVTHAELGAVTKAKIGQGATACPGINIKRSMTRLRAAVADGGIRPNFAFAVVSVPRPFSVSPLESFDIKVQLKNTGKNTWNTIKLYSGRKVFVDQKALSIRAGQTIDLKIPFDATLESGRQRYGLNVAIGGAKQRQKVDFSFNIKKPIYSYRLVSLEGGDDTLLVGEERKLKIKLRNTSNFDWPADGRYEFKLQEVTQRGDKTSLLPRGLSVTLLKDVPVSQEVEFEVDVPIQRKKGNYDLHLVPMIGRNKGLKGVKVAVDLPVELPNFEAEVVQLDRRQRVKKGFTEEVDFRVVNTSNFDWEPGMVWFSVGRRGEKQVVTETVLQGKATAFSVDLQAGYSDREVELKGYVGLERLPQKIKVRRFRRSKLSYSTTVKTAGLVRLSGEKLTQSKDLLPSKVGVYSEWVDIKNTGTVPWYKDGDDRIVLVVQDDPDYASRSWIKKSIAGFLIDDVVMPGKTARFKIDLQVRGEPRRTTYDEFTLAVGDELVKLRGGRVRFGVKGKLRERRTSTRTITTSNTAVVVNSAESGVPPMRVWLTEIDQDTVKFTSPGKFVTWDSATVQVVQHEQDEVFLVSKSDLEGGVVVRARAKEDPYFEFTNWDRIRSFGAGINDNKFRSVLEFRLDEGKMIVINELSLGDYMKGVAEVPETDDQPQAKRRVIAVLSRSYALHYLVGGYEKFPGKPYNAADSPAIFQKYVGYNFESRSPKWQGALAETEGEVVMVDELSVDPACCGAGGQLSREELILRAAYFSCTDGDRTKTAAEAGWGGNEYFKKFGSVFQSVSDPLGDDPGREGLTACGHQVGLSGYGATQMARRGDDYQEIIQYYYQNVEVEQYR